MMLNGQSGRNPTAAGVALSGPSQRESDLPAALSSRATGVARPAPLTVSSASPVSRSRKRIFAEQSSIIIARPAAVEDGASGATTAPAARTPQKAVE